MGCFSYLCKRSRIGEWLKYLCFEKYFHFSQYSSLQNNPLIQAIEFVFCVFAFYCQYFRACIIHFHGHQGRVKLPPVTSPHKWPNHRWKPSFFDVSGTRIFYAFVGYYCCILNILRRVYMWNMGLCGSVPQPWVHLKYLGPLIPAGSWTTDGWTHELVKATHGYFHEARVDHLKWFLSMGFLSVNMYHTYLQLI